MSRTNISALAGRVIESATIFHNQDDEPICMEIRCVGGLYFSFELHAEVICKAQTLLADNRTDELKDLRRRQFAVKGTFPSSGLEDGG